MTNYKDSNFKLACYLLNYQEDDTSSSVSRRLSNKRKNNKKNKSQLKAEVAELLKKLEVFHNPGLSIFRHYRHMSDGNLELREAKSSLLEDNHVFDRYVLGILKEFCIITIAFLVKLEKMHKKKILCGNVSPYTFMYNKKLKQCEPCNLGLILSDKNIVRAEKQLKGDLIYITTDLQDIDYNKYLAPELKESLLVYGLKRRLQKLSIIAESRGILLPEVDKINTILADFHQLQVKYTNKAEIYSVGYSINQILSHMLEKIARLGLTLGEPIVGKVDEKYITEANYLLPRKFDNHSSEFIIDLLNEGVEYIYDLMEENIEKRDSLSESIAKFKSLLHRITVISPEFILEFEEPEEDEVEIETDDLEDKEAGENLEEDEEYHVHDDHGHDKHGHDDDSHDEHGMFIHDHHVHDHKHVDHKHDHHKHEEHKHEEHGHEEHKHEEHGHEEHKHEEHSHEDHKHEDHGHEEHKHEEHKHNDHGHEEHQHDDHDGGHGEHGEHERHEEHGEHDDHQHDDHDGGHGEHDVHETHDTHDDHDDHHGLAHGLAGAHLAHEHESKHDASHAGNNHGPESSDDGHDSHKKPSSPDI